MKDCESCQEDEGSFGPCAGCAMHLCERCLKDHKNNECPPEPCGLCFKCNVCGNDHHMYAPASCRAAYSADV